MSRICFPNYEHRHFNSLQKAYRYFMYVKYCDFSYLIANIIQYNICYRDYLREYGIELLIEKLCDEAPELNNDSNTIDCLRKWWNDCGSCIAEYDIQCYHIQDEITILGHTFNGLNDIIKHCEMTCKEGLPGMIYCSPLERKKQADIHVGEIYERYPIFDSSDLKDRRAFRNFIFRHSPICEMDMRDALTIPHRCNFCMVNESIPHDMLPILYYKGDGEHMLLATGKRNRIVEGE